MIEYERSLEFESLEKEILFLIKVLFIIMMMVYVREYYVIIFCC